MMMMLSHFLSSCDAVVTDGHTDISVTVEYLLCFFMSVKNFILIMFDGNHSSFSHPGADMNQDPETNNHTHRYTHLSVDLSECLFQMQVEPQMNKYSNLSLMFCIDS